MAMGKSVVALSQLWQSWIPSCQRFIDGHRNFGVVGISSEVVEVVGSIDHLAFGLNNGIWHIDNSDLLVDGTREGIDAIGVFLSDFVMSCSSEYQRFVHLHGWCSVERYYNLEIRWCYL